MAARTRKVRHDDETRARIKTSQLLNRLTDHALGSVDMSSTQVTAALGVLRKSLPDLTATEHSGKVDMGIGELLNAVDGRTRGLPSGG
jgi:hypothetical protein